MKSKAGAGITIRENDDGTTKYTIWTNSGREGDKGYRVSMTWDSDGNITNLHSTDQNEDRNSPRRHH